MNIGVDIRCLMERNRTGVGEYTYGLLNAVFSLDLDKFKQLGTDEHQFFLFYNSGKDICSILPKWNRPNVHYIWTRWPNKLLNLLLWLKLIKLDKFVIRKMSKYNKNENLQMWFSPNLNFTNLSKEVKHIQTVHDLSFEILPECFTIKQRLWHWFLNPQKQCERADFILAPSENTKRDLSEIYYLATNKIFVISPKIFLCGNKAVELEEVRNKYALPEKFILYLGTLEPRKNIETLVSAFRLYKEKSVNEYQLIIAGSPGWKSEQLMRLIDQSEDIRYVGYVPNEDKPALYGLASLFVFPSLYEGFGLPVMEAESAETPAVISSNRSSLPEAISEKAFMANPDNIMEIAELMEILLKNK